MSRADPHWRMGPPGFRVDCLMAFSRYPIAATKQQSVAEKLGYTEPTAGPAVAFERSGIVACVGDACGAVSVIRVVLVR